LEERVGDELEDLTEHLERYRATTLQVFDLVEEKDLAWRPSQDQYSLGQQLLHIAQTEHHFSRGLFEGDWDPDRIRFPKSLPTIEELKEFFGTVREFTRSKLQELDPGELGGAVVVATSETRLNVSRHAGSGVVYGVAGVAGIAETGTCGVDWKKFQAPSRPRR
jgi:uncharacterized damage-inducible protein DinB